ncbi:MAG: hypothetical protein VXW83_09325, partial [SAR324 cluster bacterium]|nr:hypothetical protein [SAR324 cluster bacterium]
HHIAHYGIHAFNMIFRSKILHRLIWRHEGSLRIPVCLIEGFHHRITDFSIGHFTFLFRFFVPSEHSGSLNIPSQTKLFGI